MTEVADNADDFRAALAELIETTRPEAAEHPGAERWLAYQRGELAAGDEAALAEHLVRCRDCFDLAQAAAAFAIPAGDESAAAGGDLDARELWRRLEASRAPGGETSAPPPPARLAGRRGRQFPYALAAALFLALLSSAAWNLRQWRALAALGAPRADAPIFDFSGGERLAEAERTVRADGGPWLLVFHPSEELPLYRLTIRDATGGALSTLLLHPSADLALTVQLPAGLPLGSYRLELSAATAGSAASEPAPVLETHRLRVTEAARGG